MLLMLDHFPSLGFFLCFIYLSVSFFFFRFCFCFFFNQNFHFFVDFSVCCSVFAAKFVYGCCLVKAQGFRPGGVHSHFLPHNLYSFPVHIVGTPGEVSAPGQLSGFHQAAQNSFSGAFQNSNPNFHFYCHPPPTYLSL